jgi:hypothetical protein
MRCVTGLALTYCFITGIQCIPWGKITFLYDKPLAKERRKQNIILDE